LQENINKPEIPQPENQFDIFGKSIAVQLKALHFENALIAKTRIQNILSEMAIQNYRSRSITTGSTDRLSSEGDYRVNSPINTNHDILSNAISAAFDIEDYTNYT